MVATDVVALFVDRNGGYPERIAECYDDRRNALTYSGELPVVAHPPCQVGEWTCYVEQWRYGHKARKSTWLYYVGVRRPFALRWGYLDPKESAGAGLGKYRSLTRAQRDGRAPIVRPTHSSSFCEPRRTPDGRLHGTTKPKLTKKDAIATPPEFREELIKLARWAVAP